MILTSKLLTIIGCYAAALILCFFPFTLQGEIVRYRLPETNVKSAPVQNQSTIPNLLGRRYGKGLIEPYARRYRREISQLEIDAVYIVNTKQHIYLRYSMRSLHRYANWIRHIYLVVDEPNHLPQ